MTDISIAIVAYNDEEDVCRAVESIEAYTSKQITKKIYIIDNSTAANELSALEQKKISDLAADITVCCHFSTQNSMRL